MKPIICLDVGILAPFETPGLWNLYGLFARPRTFALAQFAAMRVKAKADIVLIHDGKYTEKQIEDYVQNDSYNYAFILRTKSEFELFRDRFCPFRIYSNMPHLECSSVTRYPAGSSFQFVFNHISDDIRF